MSDAAQEPTLGNLPEALKNRVRDVQLVDGSTVRVEKWSWAKFQALLNAVGDPSKADQIAVQSVAEGDREKVRKLDPEDILALAAAAVELNMTPGILKNLPSLLRAGDALVEALTKRPH